MEAAAQTQEEQVEEVTVEEVAAPAAQAEVPVIEEGSVVTVARKKYTVARVGKECKLVHKDGSELWRHSRTVARLQQEAAAKA